MNDFMPFKSNCMSACVSITSKKRSESHLSADMCVKTMWILDYLSNLIAYLFAFQPKNAVHEVETASR